MGKQETKDKKENTRKRHRKMVNKKPLCAKSGVINVQQSAAQEVSPVPCGCWYLKVEEQKLGRLSMHFCFGCIMGQRGQVCWWSLP